MNRFIRAIGFLMVASIAIVAAIPLGVYVYALRDLPLERTARQPDPTTRVLTPLLLASLGASEGTWRPMTPYSYLMTLLRAEPRGLKLPSRCAESLMGRQPPAGSGLRRFLAYDAATIWVTRNWSRDECVATFLDSASFGHQISGLNNAARVYFDRPAKDLTDAEMALLIATNRAPREYDLWCKPALTAEFAATLLQRTGGDSHELSKVLTRVRRPPDGTC
jgi:hypothetical protein